MFMGRGRTAGTAGAGRVHGELGMGRQAHHLGIALARRNQRPDIVSGIDDHMGQAGAVGGQQALDAFGHLIAAIDTEGLDAEGLGHLHEVRIVGQVDLGIVLGEEQLLPLAHQAQRGVVDSTIFSGMP